MEFCPLLFIEFVASVPSGTAGSLLAVINLADRPQLIVAK
jgi:hypothetical protein